MNHNSLRVKVSATSANLGSAFDCAGLALSLYNTFTLTLTQKGGIRVESEADEFANDQHLVITTCFNLLTHYHKPLPQHFILMCDCEIPIARGLGSSSTCIIAGILFANHLGQLNLSTTEMLMHATEIEGHPDNVAPALLGQLVSSIVSEETIFTHQVTPHQEWQYLAIVPHQPLETRKARQAMPTSYPLQDIVFNLSRSTLLMHAFTQTDEALLKTVTQDTLHQPYRFPLIEQIEDLLEVIKKEPVVTLWISGSGSTLMALVHHNDANRITTSLRQQLGHLAVIYCLDCETNSPQITIENNSVQTRLSQSEPH